MSETSPSVIILAGPNGAGKTTSSRALLAETLNVPIFVNADVIAQGLAGFDPASVAVEAGRIMLDRMHKLAEQRVSFAFETTLAAISYAKWLRGLRDSGWRVHLVYFWLQSANLAVARVADRVRRGGHDIPETTIRQRYQRSAANFFHLYRPVATFWHVHDNSTEWLRQIAFGDIEGNETILENATWQLFKREGRYE
jgi:predicted ABC-type ATPase